MIVENRSFVQHFRALCKKNANASNQTNIYRAASAVYLTIVNNVVHSRFCVPFRLFKEKNIKAKEKVGLRNLLKCAEAGGRKGKKVITEIKGNKKDTEKKQPQQKEQQERKVKQKSFQSRQLNSQKKQD